MVSSGAPCRPVLAGYAHYYIGVILYSSSMNCYWGLVLLLNLVSSLTFCSHVSQTEIIPQHMYTSTLIPTD